MGTPRTKTTKQYGNLREPSIAEKLSLFMLGSQAQPAATTACLNEILEAMKMLLLPMVSSQDKPLTQFSAFSSVALPSHLTDARGMLVYDGQGGFMSIALTRSGSWIVRLYGDDSQTQAVKKVTSRQLGLLVLERIRDIANPLTVELQRLQTELPFLEPLLRQWAIMQFLSNCHAAALEGIAEQERRIRIMRQRIDLLGDFSQAIDPIAIKRSGSSFPLPGFSIFSEREGGASRLTSTYFSRSALQPFWEVLRMRQEGQSTRYIEFNDTRNFSSLSDFLSMLGRAIHEIEGSSGVIPPWTPKTILGCSGSRLPLAKEEVAALQAWVESLGLVGDKST